MSTPIQHPLAELREHLVETRDICRSEGNHRVAFRAEVGIDIESDAEALMHGIADSAQSIAIETRKILSDGKVTRSEFKKLRQLACVADGIAAEAII